MTAQTKQAHIRRSDEFRPFPYSETSYKTTQPSKRRSIDFVRMASLKISPEYKYNLSESKIQMAQTMLTRTRGGKDGTLFARRVQCRADLDSVSDFSITHSGITFRQSFVSLESDESFFVAPNCLTDSCRELLSLHLDCTVARVVHDNVTVQIGCSTVPVFALVNGGRDRTLFTFRCVYEDCSAFLDIRKFAGADRLK